jgi:ribosomal-protein-alanine N-acetyltransferase
MMMNAVVSKPFRRLRLMRSDDLSAIMEIENRVYPFPWTLQIFQDCLQAGYQLWVLEQDDRIIGYGVMSIGADEAHLLNICIHPDYRGQGYGRFLLEELLQFAKQQWVTIIFLEVRSSNQIAMNLYFQVGFNQVGIRKRYYPALQGREDAFIFALDLT